MSKPFDTLIFGAGPAGLATAIALRQHGRTVMVLSREEPLRGTGESLAATARLSLIRLSLWKTFLQDAHPPCYANRSAWGDDVVRHYSFIQSANGHGWHIDRERFDLRLLEQVASLGVQIVHSKQHSIQQENDGTWQVQSDSLLEPVFARIAVDATGRNSWLARQLGVERLKSDDQIALVAFLKTKGQPLEDHSSLVESVPDGWWYSALQPDGRLACIFFTDPDLHDNRSLCSPEHWLPLVRQSNFTYQRIEKFGYQLDNIPFFKSANSSLLAQLHGNNWLAVGDAAMSFDPLSSHGLSLALVSGWDAAQAIHGYLAGVPHLLEHYATVLQLAFLEYVSKRMEYYNLEKRWKDQAFWERRQQVEDPVITQIRLPGE